MRCEIEGELLEVQGCIERALDIITANAWKYLRIESSATREYVFSHMELGEVGKIKISILPKGRTELYSYQSEFPEEKWLVKYLPSHVPLGSLSEPLRKLLSVYTWQIANNIFNLNSIELYKLAYSNTTVDWGWESYGLGDFDLRKSALDEFRNWQNKIHELQRKELEQILDVIVIQIRIDGLSMALYDGKTPNPKVLLGSSESLLPGKALTPPPKPPEPKSKGGKINLWLDWYHAMLDNGYKCTLEVVAEKSGYSVGYVKQRHMVYISKPNQNS